MLRNWLRGLVNRKSTGARRNDRSSARFLPKLEGLEVREVPATMRWINPAGGDWATAANWDSCAVPGPADDAIIAVAAASPTITHATGNHTVRSLSSTEPFTMTGGTLTLSAASTVSGGLLTLAGGTLRAQAGLSLDRLTVSNGTAPAALLDGTGNVTVSGLMTFSGGRIAGTGSLRANGGIRFDTAATKTVGRHVISTGNDEWMGGPIRVANAAGQRVHFTSSGHLTVRGSNLGLTVASNTTAGGEARFVKDAGLLTKLANTATTTLAGLSFTGGEMIVQDSLAANGQKLRVSGSGVGTFRVGVNATLGVSGTYNLQQGGAATGAGRVEVGGVGTPAGSNLILNTASVAAAAGVTVASGATLTGAGTINTNLVNHGIVDPGFYLGAGRADPRTITVTGSYTQSAQAQLRLAITPTGHDQLVVSGQATLGGIFAVEGLGFIDVRPALGATHRLVSYGSRVGHCQQLTYVVLPGIPNPYLPVRYIKYQTPSVYGATGITYEVTDRL